MRITPLRIVVGLVVLGAALGWTLLGLFRSGMSPVPHLPWSAAGGLTLFAALLFLGAWYVYDRVHRKGHGVDALLALRLLLVGKASVLVAALVSGGYFGFGLGRARMASAGMSSEQTVTAFASAGAGVLVVVGAALLERACKIPEGQDGSDEGGIGNDEAQP